MSDFSFFFSPSLPLSISPEARKKRRTRKKQRGSGENSKTPSLSFVVDAHSPDAHRGSYSYLLPWIQCYVSIYISQAVPWSATVYVNVATAYALRYGRVSPLSAQPSFRIYRVCRCLSNQPRGEQKESYEREGKNRTRKKRFDCSIKM